MSIVKVIIDFVMDILETVVFTGSLFIALYLFILQPNQVKGASMEPTFYTGEYILTSKITYKFKNIQHGDVIVFKSPKNPDIEYIKRIIGLPGDKLSITNGVVKVNDNIITENYIFSTTNLWEGGYTKNGQEITVPQEEIYVMGDNRARSSDSREFGPVPISSIIGYVFYRYYPANKNGMIENPWPKNLQSLSLTNFLSREKFLPSFRRSL